MSRVDVFIPCYKYGRFLRSCVDSVLSQEGMDARILIIDDASPDHTPEVAAELVRRDARVEYWRHTINHGHIATYNEGLAWASGDYTLLLNADDMLTPGSLLRASRLMDAHPDVGLTYGEAIFTDRPELVEPLIPHPHTWEVMTGAQFVEANCADGRNIVPTPTAVVRTQLQKELGGIRKELPHAGDMEMWLRLAAHASVGVVNAAQAYYRLHGENMSFGFAGLPDLQQKQAAFETFFDNYSHRLAQSQRLQRLAHESLAHEALRYANRLFDSGDLATSQHFLDFAVQVHPGLKSRPEWARFRFKRLLGPRTCSVLRPVARWARRHVVRRAPTEPVSKGQSAIAG
jgi:hypothetical protein